MPRLSFRPLALALPLALTTACGDFDRYDDRIFDFPAQAAPPIPHPIPYVPEPEPTLTAEAMPEPALEQASADAPNPIPAPAQPADDILEAAAATESPSKISRRDEGPGRHRPAIDAPRKNMGMKADRKAREAALKDFSDPELARRSRMQKRTTSRERDGDDMRRQKKTPLSMARDGDN
ncbi:MAG: hypothetical protein LBM75_02210 [Myxococcales bacterium]|jgi:hypothetical protein|nr:hypothetical protein [Myxococcales bacterium]